MKNTQKLLKSRGYKLINTEKSPIEINTSMEKIAESFSNIEEKLQQQINENNSRLSTVVNELIQKQEPKLQEKVDIKKTWEFNIQRSKDGFISKIFAKEI